MKSIAKKFLIFFVLIYLNSLSAQDFSGKATYKTRRFSLVKLDSTDANYEMRKRIQERIGKHHEKAYVLTFNNKESIYNKAQGDDILEKPNPKSNMTFSISSGNENLVLYRDYSRRISINQMDLLGKLFLVKDTLQPIDWELSSETKYIGDYKCFKATQKIKIVQNNFSIDSDGTKEDRESNEIEKEIIVIAWYTPELPVSSGPSAYWGLPGLILEINDGFQVMICSKIVLNPIEEVVIVPPEKGKEISSKKFNELVMKKMNNLSVEDLLRN